MDFERDYQVRILSKQVAGQVDRVDKATLEDKGRKESFTCRMNLNAPCNPQPYVRLHPYDKRGDALSCSAYLLVHREGTYPPSNSPEGAEEGLSKHTSKRDAMP